MCEIFAMLSAVARQLPAKQATMGDILEALRRAPVRVIIEEEQSLLAELRGEPLSENEGRPVQWLSHEAFVAELGVAAATTRGASKP